MLRVAILDDNADDLLQIQTHMQHFCKNNQTEMDIVCFSSALELLTIHEKTPFDVMLLDVEMPGINGMQAAHQIRETDPGCAIIFITNMAQYALEGYEVNATDFMVKPVAYASFERKIRRAVEFVRKHQSGFLLLERNSAKVRVPIRQILYLEKDKNYIVWHTRQGIFRERGTIADAEAKLNGAAAFAACNSGCIINLNDVDSINKDSVTLEDITIPVSRRMYKQLLQAFLDWN